MKKLIKTSKSLFIKEVLLIITLLIMTTTVVSDISYAQTNQTYYISSSSGDGTNDGLSPETAWQTIEQVNTITLADNDTILFRRGDTFRGELRLNKTPVGVTVGAYGEGDNPIFAGSVVIKNWTQTSHPNLSDAIYEADVSAVGLDEDNGIYHLFVDGELMTIARYPNVNSPADKNWLTVKAKSGKDGFTDTALAALNKPDNYWQGATLRIRNYSWTYTVAEITTSVGATGKIQAERLNNQLPEWGYFLDNKLEELDQAGEWFYDATTKKVYLYPKGNLNPNDALIEGATFSGGFQANFNEHQTVVENITFRHYIGAAMHVSQTEGVIVRNCYFEHNGTGVSVWNGANVLVQNNTFGNNLKAGISLNAQSDFDLQAATIEKNQITNTALYPLYGQRYDGVYQGIGISVFGTAYTIRQNIIENSAQAGMYLKDGGHHLIEHNVVRNALLLLNDGGAIGIGSDGNIIRGNFLLNSHGNIDESNGCASTNSDPCAKHSAYGMGIGADRNYTDNVIENNVVANNRDMGIRLNAFENTIVRNNILYNNDPGIAIEDKHGTSRNNTIENNIIYALAPDQLGLTMTNNTDHGTLKNNLYSNPYSKIAIRRDNIRYSLAHFQNQFSELEQGSTAVHVAYPEYTISQTGTNLIENSSFEVDVSGWKPSTKIFHDTTQTKLDGGSLRAETGGAAMNLIPNTLAITEGQWYHLQFSVIGNGFGRFRLRGNRTAPEYQILEERYFAYDTNRNDYSFVFKGQETTDSFKFLFATGESDADTYWVDNVTFTPVAVSLNDGQYYSKLLLNPTDTKTTVDLQGVGYQDLSGNSVSGSLDLEPYSAQILHYRQGDLPTPASQFGYLPVVVK